MGRLDIPRFDDFLNEMGDGRSQRWADDAIKEVQRDIGISYDLTNPDDARRFVSAMFALNQRATVYMMHDYHDWLCRQLDSKTLRLL